jgi:hypothetical protein
MAEKNDERKEHMRVPTVRLEQENIAEALR